MHPLDLAIVVGYLVTIVGVGIAFSRGVHDAKDYFLAGRSLSFWLIGLSIIGTNVSAEGYVGAAGSAYNLGIAQANFEWIGAIPAMILASLVFIPLYWRAGVYSIPEYLGRRYSQTVRIVAATIASVFSVFAIGVALWALALTLNTYIGWPIWLGITATGIAIGLYSVAGGLRAVAFTDALQVVIMFGCGAAIAFIGLDGAGGAAAFADTLTRENPNHLSVYLPSDHADFPWPGVILGLGIVLSPAYWCGSQAILQRTLGARSQWDASASMMLAAFAKTFVPLLIVFPGLLALVMQANIEYPDMALPWVVKNVLPPGLSGLMFIAIIAALQSSVDSGINSTSLMITRDIRHVLWPDADRSRDLVIGRWFTLIILLGAMATAPFIGELGGMYFVIQTLLSLFQGPMLALLVLGAFSRHATPRAGVITLLGGVPIAGLLLWGFGWNMLYVAFTMFCASLVSIWVLSYRTPPLADDELQTLVYSRSAV